MGGFPLPALAIEHRAEHERPALEQAIASIARLRQPALTAPGGTALAAGDLELPIDAGKVNTPAGWRDVQVAVFARRPRGVPTTAADWDERDRPAPAVRPVAAAPEEAGAFGRRRAAEAGRLNDAPRLRRGQSIGSGLVEGSIKQLLNKRLKQTGARWKVEHVGPSVELGALAAGPEWPALWEPN